MQTAGYKVIVRMVSGSRNRLDVVEGSTEAGEMLPAPVADIAVALEYLNPIFRGIVEITFSLFINGLQC